MSIPVGSFEWWDCVAVFVISAAFLVEFLWWLISASIRNRFRMKVRRP